jgi:23S rRNA (cytidine1920-2'-O)/16S rRNA (cytidine1409-2'-O)-methyltransferase
VDTGYGQMDFGLRQDARVRLVEKTNARYLAHEAVGVAVDFIAMDVSFISATLVLPPVIAAAFPKVRTAMQGLGAQKTDTIESPILGVAGNREFLLYGAF